MTSKATDTQAGPGSPQGPAPLSEAQIAALLERQPDKLKPHAGDLAAYWRALPRLLAEGHEGRWALVAEGRVHETFDTFRDASQAGYDRYGPDRPFLTPRIERRDLERLAALATALVATGAPPKGVPCPS